jgi:hypothetical protein
MGNAPVVAGVAGATPPHVLMRFDHVAGLVVKADHSIV